MLMRANTTRRFIAGTAIVGAAVAAFILTNSTATAQSENAGAMYRAMLTELNNSNASGEATLTRRGNTLMVHITATGLEPGGPHLSHIHGLSKGKAAVDSTCPTQAQDSDGDGFVELAEGQVKYGPILVDFMNIDPDQDGTVDFTTTIQLSGNQDVIPLQMRHIVIHGLTVGAVGAGTPGEVDGTAGYKTVLPILCGEIRNANGNKGAMEFRTR
jgi:Cu/Zn superoxide dismutase